MFIEKFTNDDYQEFLDTLGYKIKDSDNAVRLFEGNEHSFALVSCEEDKIVKEFKNALFEMYKIPRCMGLYDISNCIVFHDFSCQEFGEDDKEYHQEWYNFMSRKFPNYEEEYEKAYQKMVEEHKSEGENNGKEY